MPRRPSKKAAGKPRPVNRGDAKINKWNKTSDIPLDEEDEFHASRDKILLEGNEYGGDDDGDDDEVFGLDLSDNEEVEDEEEAEDDDEEVPVAKSKSSKSKSKAKTKAKAKTSSEEEESDEDEAWGRGRSAYYSSNAAQLDSDDEEGNELEEQEAKRLQAKSRDAMADDDFGLGDAVEVIAIDAPEESAPTEEPVSQDPKSLIRHLEKTSPETLALARDWEDTAENLVKTRQKIATLEASDPDSVILGMVHLHYQALLSYATALAFYLHLRSSAKYARRPDLLRTHPVLSRLLTLKQSLITLEDLDFAASDSEAGPDEDDSDPDLMMDAEQLWKLNRMEGLEEDELDDLLEDADLPEPEVEVRPKKKRKTSTTSAPLPVFDLIEPEFTSSTSAQHRPDSSTDAYGEATALQHADAADKSARRKSLRFHTSRIESASARRQGARSNAVGGDDDIPYRDTRKQQGKVPQKLRGQGGEDLDESEPQAKIPDADTEDADGYYELVNRKSKLKKELKKAEYEAAQEAARPDFDDGGAGGPRSLTRAILSNKGLTPHRPKSVRNPRVKKREKFRKANMKISSQKAVFKGGLAEAGRYDGEKSGISKVVKSVRLG
ncbi:Sas10 C-terminal domain-containing protein [Mycena olivaceomarginata]|nr:Sas10 C-terminal domain-containing protein [Mycena olivaceomarginata]